jgi:hypothetical protein
MSPPKKRNPAPVAKTRNGVDENQFATTTVKRPGPDFKTESGGPP